MAEKTDSDASHGEEQGTKWASWQITGKNADDPEAEVDDHSASGQDEIVSMKESTSEISEKQELMSENNKGDDQVAESELVTGNEKDEPVPTIGNIEEEEQVSAIEGKSVGESEAMDVNDHDEKDCTQNVSMRMLDSNETTDSKVAPEIDIHCDDTSLVDDEHITVSPDAITAPESVIYEGNEPDSETCTMLNEEQRTESPESSSNEVQDQSCDTNENKVENNPVPHEEGETISVDALESEIPVLGVSEEAEPGLDVKPTSNIEQFDQKNDQDPVETENVDELVEEVSQVTAADENNEPESNKTAELKDPSLVNPEHQDSNVQRESKAPLKKKSASDTITSRSSVNKDFKSHKELPRGRGYQENRRYDRDRRDKRKGNDGGNNADYESSSRDSTESTSTKAGQSASAGSMPVRGDGEQRNSVVKERGSKKPEPQGRDRRKSNEQSIGKGSRNTAGKSSENGADLLSLLNQPKEDKSGGLSSPGAKTRPGKEIRGKGKSAADLEAQWQKEEEEKIKKEEEEKKKIQEQRRQEEERIRLEDEKKRKEEEEAQRIRDEEIRSIDEYIQETAERIQWKSVLREANIKAAETRPDDSFFGRLDSSLKKNTAFVKKLRNLTESQKESLTKDFNALNLSKYVGEVTVAIVEAKLKMSDVGCALHISSLLHQRYAEFAPTLLENWNKVLLTKKDEKVPNPSKLRVDLRFFADLVAVGVFTQKEGLPVLANQLNFLISNDKDEHNNVTILLSFCKHCGADYAGLLSRKFRLLAEKYDRVIPHSAVLPAERQKACRNLLKDYFTSLCKHLELGHKELKYMEKQNRKILQTKGELSTERKEKHEAAVQSFQKLYNNTQTYADLLDDNLPELPEEDYKPDSDVMGCDIYHPMSAEYEYSGDSTLFEDEDTRQFYENIPDLKAVIPQILYKDSEQAVSPEQPSQDGILEEELDVEELEKALALEMEQEQEPAEKEVSGSGEKTLDISVDTEPDLPLDQEEEDTDIASSMKLVLETFLANLPNCVNRDLIDRAANDFCMNMNTKVNRKKLVRALFTVHRTRYDLLPFYSRLVATLHPCMPDVANDLGVLLKGDFKWHVRKKDQINIESKLKTVRFIGELTKFNMFPKAETLHCLKMLLFDFSHHNIEMGCSLLETCGRFLYRTLESHHRTKVYLEVMMRKKAALHFDQRYKTMIENAYYYSNPPDTKPEAKKIRPPMHEYIRKLLYKDLSKITVEKVLRQLRKLDWDSKKIRFYATKCLVAVWNVRYNSIHCCANLLAGLASYHEDVAIEVVDGVLEDIRLGMEINHPKFNQRRVSCVKYLGELYNYRLVESGVIFKTLYSFITFGVSLDEDYPSYLDPPEHLFRIRLTCILLDTCGQYFDRGSSRKKLEYFLNYFLRYYWFKRNSVAWTHEHPFPIDIEYTMRDTMDLVKPKNKFPASYEEAKTTVEEMEKELLARIAEVLPIFKSVDVGAESETDGGLPTIQENEETDDMSQGLSQVQAKTDGTQDSHTQDSDGEREATGSQGNSQNKPRHMEDEGEEGEGAVEEESGSEEELDEDLMNSAEEDDADDQMTVVTGGLKHIACTEDEDFMAAFDKMLTDNIQARSQEAVKSVEIAVPMNVKLHNKPKPPVSFVGMVPVEEEEEEEEMQPNTNSMKFTLVTRKGNKQQFATLSIPVSQNFASKIKEHEEAEKAEKERMKRVVLDIHERQEEEDYQEMIASMSRPAMVNVNRERKVKYQHPKGAPDADLIFGSKKR